MSDPQNHKPSLFLTSERSMCAVAREERAILRGLTTKGEGLARGVRGELAEIYRRIRWGEPKVLGLAWTWWSREFEVRRQYLLALRTAQLTRSRLTAEQRRHCIESTILVDSTGSPSPGDEGARMTLESAEMSVVSLESRIAELEAQTSVARWAFGMVVQRFARCLAGRVPFEDEGGAFPSATHALLQIVDAVAEPDNRLQDTRRLLRALVHAQSEWLRLESPEHSCHQVPECRRLVPSAPAGDLVGRSMVGGGTSSSAPCVAPGAVTPPVSISKPAVPCDASHEIRAALILKYRPSNMKALAAALGASRSTLSRAMATGFEPAPNHGPYALRPTQANLASLNSKFDTDSVPPWCADVMQGLEKYAAAAGRRRKNGVVSGKAKPRKV